MIDPTSTYPTTLDTMEDPGATDLMNATNLEHDLLHQKENDAIEKLQAKVGVSSSAVATSLDYKVTSTSSSNPGHKHTLANGATDVTATAAEVNKLSGLTAVANELNITDGGEVNERVLNTNCKCYAYPANNQLNIADTTFTKVILDTEGFDVGSDFDTANSRFVAPVSGYYIVTGSVEWVPNTVADGKSVFVSIYVNGSQYLKSRTPTMTGALAVNSYIGSSISSIVYCPAGQYIELYCYQATGASTADIERSGTHLSIHLLSV